jgi:hypothetical protein
VGLDRRLQPVDPHLVLDPAHGVGEHTGVDHRRDLVVVGHPALELVVEVVDGPFPDPDHAGPDVRQRAHEVPLRGRKGGLDEDDVHGGERRRR